MSVETTSDIRIPLQPVVVDRVPPSWRPPAVADLLVELRARLRDAHWQLMGAVDTDVERSMLRFELDQLQHALSSDSPAAGTAFSWRRVRALVRGRAPAAAPITALVHELFG